MIKPDFHTTRVEMCMTITFVIYRINWLLWPLKLTSWGLFPMFTYDSLYYTDVLYIYRCIYVRIVKSDY